MSDWQYGDQDNQNVLSKAMKRKERPIEAVGAVPALDHGYAWALSGKR